ncbi:MAG: glycosyltransferase [Bacteroidetes bacterium]|nr:glycosyltransferase [Bacteroidota bacterium]
MNNDSKFEVSAIVSTYNSELFIEGCLVDLTNQTLYKKGGLEILVINSGSQQNEEVIINEFQRKFQNIKYIKTENREGIYSAWNRGVKAASGKYLTNANTDDRHHPEALEILKNELDKNPDVDLVYSDFYLTNTPNQQFKNAIIDKEIIRPDFKPGIMHEGCFMGPQPMWRAEVHNYIGYFNEAYKSSGDFEFWSRMVFVNGSKLKRVNQILGLYYYNQSGIELGNFSRSSFETNVLINTYKNFVAKQKIINDCRPIDIVFLTHDRLKYFHETINHLIHNTKYNYRLIIVDNKSGEEFANYLKLTEILYDDLILNGSNEWTAAFQKGINVTTSDPFIVCDPDILVPKLDEKCWLEKLVDLHKQNPDMGLIALNLDPSNKPEKMADVYISEKSKFNDDITLSNVGTVMQAIKRKYFNFSYTTDWETCEKIRANGGKVGFAKNIVGYHLGWNEEKDYPDYIVDKFKYFKNNYGVDTYKLYTTDSNIINKMDESVGAYYEYNRPEVQELVNPNSQRILDVGCGSGVMAYELKQKLNAEVWGIELFEEAAKRAAAKLDNVIWGNVEDAILQLPNNYFDAIIFADVLEHLVDPYKIIKLIKTKLRNNGEIVASIPNVRHWSVIKNLIEGKWDYENAGLLDKTHLRFFTLKSAAELFTNEGFNVIDVKATMDAKFEFPSDLMQAFKNSGYDVSSLQENSQHYQYLFKTRKISVQIETSIIIPVYNQLETTQSTINSIYENTKGNFELVIVDNNSSDEIKKYLRNLEIQKPNVKTISNTRNLGFPKAVNQGIEFSEGKYIVIANNDIIVNKGWLNRFIDIAANNEKAGIISGISNSVSGVQVDKNANYQTIDEMKTYAEKIRFENQNQYWEFPRVAFLCTLIKKEVIEKIGGLDERFSPGNYEDDDYCLRVQLAGYKTFIAKDVFIHHYGSKSFKADGNDKYEKLLNRNNNLFVEKWGADPDEIWLKGESVKKRSLEFPISGSRIEKYFRRGFINIHDNEYELAKEELTNCVNEFEKNGKTEEGNISLQKIKELLSKVETVAEQSLNGKNAQWTASTVNL